MNNSFEAIWKKKNITKKEMIAKKKMSLNQRSNLSLPSSLIVNAAKDANKLFITNGVGKSVCIYASCLQYLKEGKNKWEAYHC